MGASQIRVPQELYYRDQRTAVEDVIIEVGKDTTQPTGHEVVISLRENHATKDSMP